MCTAQPRYRLLKRASLDSMNWPLQLSERGSWVEPRRALLPFRPFRGWKGFLLSCLMLRRIIVYVSGNRTRGIGRLYAASAYAALCRACDGGGGPGDLS